MTSWLSSVLANHLWQSTLCVFVVWLATLALRQNDARVRYWLWTAASIKFLVPLSLLVSLGASLQWRDTPVVVQPAVSFVMEDVLMPASVTFVAPTSSAPSTPAWPWLLMAIWCAGTMAVLMSWCRQWVRIRSALRDATSLQLDEQYDAADLAVMASPSMPEPGVVGIHRPRLLLPDGIVERLTPAQLGALIAHERCHIKCHDNLVAAIHMVVEAIFWFHPAVWWLERRLVDERERACDEAVLRAGSRPQVYAEGILEVCRQSVGVRLACVAGVSGSNLRARVEAIMRNEIGRPMTRGRRLALAVAIVAVVGGPVAGGALSVHSQIVVPPALTFDTASVARSKLGSGPIEPGPLRLEASLMRHAMSRHGGGQFRMGGPLNSLIQAAYNVTHFQIEGSSDWVLTDRYEIDARTPVDATPDQKRAMLQSLLADRFHLALRRETRTLPVYELVVASSGLNIPAAKEGDCIPNKDVRWDLIDLEKPLFICGGWRRMALSQSPETRPRPQWPRVHRIEAGAVPMAAVIDFISPDVDRPVMDKTGFTAPFNLVLDFAPGADMDRITPSGPTIFAALEEQLGLLLRPADAPVDVLVIERVERPSGN
jgi:bla regulator protein BlaR1